MNATDVEPFLSEHARLRRGLERIRQTAAELDSLTPEVRRRRIRGLLDFLEGRLAKHAEAEENALYPLVARHLRHPAATAPMVFDHELMRERAQALAGADLDDVARLRELLYGLYAILDAHFRKEERFYLPLLEGGPEAGDVYHAMEAVELAKADETVRRRELGAHGFPLNGTDGEKLAWSVSYAILAPSSHNSQPWRFHVEGDALELRADRTRALAVVDPHDRELTISCGASLFHVRAALREAGETAVVETLPDPAEPDLLARVRLGGRQRPALAEKQLFWSIRSRRTNRRRYQDKPVPAGTLATLERAAGEEGARLVVLRGEQERARLAELVAAADRLQASDPGFRRELASWLHPNRDETGDGIPGSALGMPAILSPVGPFVIRTFDWGRRRAARDGQLALGSPVLAVLTTKADEPADWLAAGQALANVLLRATAEDVVASFLNQPVEVEELRGELAALGGDGVPQLVLRMGYARPVQPTASRPVEDVLG